MRTQEPGEPIDVFMTDPYGLSEHCEFGAIREELIRDRRGGVTRCKAEWYSPAVVVPKFKWKSMDM